jgi:4-azaleucine resistance transporter AzlC
MDMRSTWRTPDPTLLCDALAISASAAVSGASFGAITVASGSPWWTPLLMSVVVFAGGAQFMAVGITTTGGSPLAAVLAGLLLNLRLLPFGLAIGNLLGQHPLHKLLGSHLLTDETVAFTLAQRDPTQARTAFWLSGLCLFTAWNTGVLIGALLGNSIGDPTTFGLDAAFPAALLALVLPALIDRPTRRAALTGAAIALATTPFTPAGVPVLLGLTGLLALRLPLPASR